MTISTVRRDAPMTRGLSFFDTLHEPQDTFETDVLAGLAAPHKVISPKHLYDQHGSEVFEQITALPEYYVARTEIALLKDKAAEIAEAVGPDAVVIEPGAGALVKIRVLLDTLTAPAGYVGLDISGDHLKAALETLAADYPRLRIGGYQADFTQGLELPDEAFAGAARRLVFFPGSTIGNFPEGTAARTLSALRRTLRRGDLLLLGTDQPKDPAVLEAAYGDAQGVTEKFIRNMMVRINTELGGDYDPDGFVYKARWAPERSRVEMRLISTRPQTLRVAGQAFPFSAGEELEISNSRKFTPEAAIDLAARARFAPVTVWTDPKDWYAAHLFEAA